MEINIVLVAPEIPQNTGAIGRLCVCTDARLHLVRPLGFHLDAAHVRRAGLDYWEYVQLSVHDDWASFLRAERPGRLWFLSTQGKRDYLDVSYELGDYLVFGRESSGLPPAFHQCYGERMIQIPMPGAHHRSHNLANAVSIVLYEAYRQLCHRPAG